MQISSHQLEGIATHGDTELVLSEVLYKLVLFHVFRSGDSGQAANLLSVPFTVLTSVRGQKLHPYCVSLASTKVK